MNTEDIFQSLEKLRCIDPSQGKKTGLFIENKLEEDQIENFLKHIDKCEKCSKIVFLNEYLEEISEPQVAANGA